MQIFGLIWGVLSIFLMMLGLFPCFGAINWIAIPFAVIGLLICGLAVALANQSESKASGIVGIVLCISVMIFGGIRLILGGGIL